MRVFFIQNGLVDRETHYFDETAVFQEAFGRRGIGFRPYIGTRAAADIVSELGAVPCFPLASDATLPCEPGLEELHEFLRKGDSFAMACRRLEQDGVGAEDLVIVAFSSEAEMHGMAGWLRTLAKGKRPRVAFVFHNPDFRWPVRDGQVVANGRYHRYAWLEMAEAVGEGRFHVWATTEALGRVLGKMMGHRCGWLPLAKVYPTDEELDRWIAETGPWPRVDLAIMGQYRPEKGGDLIPRVLAAVSQARPGVSIAIQVRSEEDADTLRKVMAPIAGRLDLQLHAGALEKRAYASLMVSAEVILCPYRPRRYAMRASGIFVEALAFGKPVVVPNGSWMMEQLAAGFGAGISFAEYTTASVARAVVAALDQREPLLRAAESHRLRWRKHQHVDAALDELLRHFGEG